MKPAFLILCAALLLAAAPSDAHAQDQDIRAFVQQIYYQGVPYAEANAYGADAVPTLLEMLVDSTQADYWANVVVTLCIIGDERAVQPVIDFIESGAEGESSDALYRAKREGRNRVCLATA